MSQHLADDPLQSVKPILFVGAIGRKRMLAGQRVMVTAVTSPTSKGYEEGEEVLQAPASLPRHKRTDSKYYIVCAFNARASQASPCMQHQHLYTVTPCRDYWSVSVRIPPCPRKLDS